MNKKHLRIKILKNKKTTTRKLQEEFSFRNAVRNLKNLPSSVVQKVKNLNKYGTGSTIESIKQNIRVGVLYYISQEDIINQCNNIVSQKSAPVRTINAVSVTQIKLDTEEFNKQIIPKIFKKRLSISISECFIKFFIYDYEKIKNAKTKEKIFKTTNNIYYTINVTYNLNIKNNKFPESIDIVKDKEASKSLLPFVSSVFLDFVNRDPFLVVSSKYAKVINTLNSTRENATVSGVIK